MYEGYVKDKGGRIKPDYGWWITQINSGIRYREKKSWEDSHDRWREYARSEFGYGLFTNNLFHKFKSTIVPRIYFRNPSIAVSSRKPGPMNSAFSIILQRASNIILKQMRYKQHVKKVVHDSFFTGTGVLKLGFGAEFTPTPDSDFTEVPIDRNGFRSEFRSGISPNMPWVSHVSLSNFILPEFVDSIENSFFQAHYVNRYLDDVLRDPRIPKIKIKKKNSGFSANSIEPYMRYFDDNLQRSRDVVKLLEIRDRRFRKVIIFAPEITEDVLFFEDDELQTNYSSPYYIYTPNFDSDCVWGVPDSKILEPYQEQMNEINTKIFEHAKASIVKFLVEKGAIDPNEASKMNNDQINAFIYVNKISGIQQITASSIPQDLLIEKQQIDEDAREALGMSRNSMGNFDSPRSHNQKTATEVAAVQQSTEIRLDERRDMLADMTVDVVSDIHKIIFRHFTQEQVIDIIGENGQKVWVKFTGKMLREGDYDINIDPDTSIPETKDLKDARASRLFNELMSAAASDPEINQRLNKDQLIDYRLRNAQVPDADLFRTDKNVISGEPLNIDQFAEVVKGGGISQNQGFL